MTETPKEVTDTTGQIVWQADYKAWGEIDLYRVHQIDQPLRFQGQYADDETGLYYTTFRYYDPRAGRFATQDPIGLAGGWNLYQYAPNPTGWVDPLGLDYTVWQIHSPGYDDIIQKGLHFYAPGGVELSVRPNNKGGITFTNSIPNEKGNIKVDKAIVLAKKHFEENAKFRNDILNKASEGVKSVLNLAKNEKGSLRNLANGRSRELRDIAHNVGRYNKAKDCL